MIRIALKLYDYLKANKIINLLSFCFVTVFLVVQASRLHYNEDISDFLPLKGNDMKALEVYQNIAGANKLIITFSQEEVDSSSPDSIIQAITAYVDRVKQKDNDGMIHNLVDRIDMEKFAFISGFAYNNVPYFLEEKDYAHMDSVLANSNYITEQVARDKEMLMFPMGGLLSDNMSKDPLNLFTPVISQLINSSPNLSYELYDGYIFSPDMKRGLIMLSSPFGSSETEKNSQLVKLLEETSLEIEKQHVNLQIHVMGGPVIAVGNANQIKNDSILSIVLAVSLIMLLLWFTLRNIRNLLLIVVSIGWGWLFALCGLALVRDEISLIVIGISSVILGIAVNYPLHLIAHLSHTPNTRNALREIVSPLVVGNITTVGAFLSLVPLESVSLSDLGLFSSFLLLGSILFVLIFLPHVVKVREKKGSSSWNKIGEIKIENQPWLVVVILGLTAFFACFTKNTSFDSNMSSINYMTEEQKTNMAYLAKMISGSSDNENLYIVSNDSTLNGALDKSLKFRSTLNLLVEKQDIKLNSCNKYIISEAEQAKRLKRWEEFKLEHADKLQENLRLAMKKEGFSKNSFNDFFDILGKEYSVHKFTYFQDFAETLFTGNLCMNREKSDYNVIDVLTFKKEELNNIKSELNPKLESRFMFDVTSMNNAISETLSKDFDYIGVACGTIVFFFLWFSLGSIELAILSFIPMFISWIWILGIMGLTGINFNIVNVILATFIFGQGDDYTIFMTEGACYEYAYRKKMLASYKNSIIISALIMFIGIGSLIFAKHPALFSLAQVTIIGMFSVVLMAYLFPPLIYNWLVKYQGKYRTRPISLIPLIRFTYSGVIFFIQLASVYVLGFILLDFMKPTKTRRNLFRRYISSLYRFDMNHLPSVKFRIKNICQEKLDKPALIICNHQSLLDTACLLAFSPKIVFIANECAMNHWCIKKVFKWMSHILLNDTHNIDKDKISELIKEGFSICIFPEGKRNDESKILRFHKGAFALAKELEMDVLPIFLHGANYVLPYKVFALHKGSIYVEVLKRVEFSGFKKYNTDDIWRHFYHLYKSHYLQLAKEIEDAKYFKELVKDRFRYKGSDLYRKICYRLKVNNCYSSIIDTIPESVKNIVVYNDDCEEFILLLSLVHKDKKIYTVEKNEESARLLTFCAEDIVKNLYIYADSLSDEMNRLNEAADTYIYKVSGATIKLCKE